MNSDHKTYLSACAEIYRSELVNNILPFWLENGLDRVNGGYYTCLDRDGTLMDTMKSVWFQGRGAFIFANAYNEIEQRPEWLEASKSGIDFIDRHCFDTDGRMYFEVTAQGVPLRKRRYLFSESFACIAYAEYALATGDRVYAQKALDLFKLILRYKNDASLQQPKYLPNYATKGHSLCMILINTASRIRRVCDDQVLTAQIDESIAEIERDFLKPEFKALLETVGPNGEFLDSIAGRLINPGHCIETAWFILEEARYRGDKHLVDLGLTILDWSWEWGWDKEFGGIINFRDCKGYSSQDYAHDMKFWWPQNETVIATLYAYQATGDDKYLQWHRMANEWSFAHLQDKEYSEWYGYLHRDGSVSQPAKGNIFKGPFHIPRMLITAHKLCMQITTL